MGNATRLSCRAKNPTGSVTDALMTAMAYVALRDLAERGIRIPRQPLRGAHSFEIG